MTFEDFLQSVYQRFPQETHMILGSADASPESGPAKKNATSYAIDLLPDFDIVDSREFDRATLGLKAFFEIITGTDLDKWTINKKIIKEITNWVVPQIKNNDDLEAWSYAILFNDLGKLHTSNEHHEKMYNNHAADHDANMVDILKADPEFYPGFLTLPQRYQESLILGLGSGFNLGKAVQLESPNNAWYPFLKLNEFDQNFHLGHCLFDFIGVSGAGNPREYAPFVMNDNTLGSFLNIIRLHNHLDYGMFRLEQVGLSVCIEHAFPISRLIAMARIFDKPNRDKLMNAIGLLPQQTKEVLFNELNTPGCKQYPAIELQYSPAILNQVVNNEDETVIAKTLASMAHLFKSARQDLHNQNTQSDIYIFNLIDLASAIRQDASSALDNIEQSSMKNMNGGWKWTAPAQPSHDVKNTKLKM